MCFLFLSRRQSPISDKSANDPVLLLLRAGKSCACGEAGQGSLARYSHAGCSVEISILHMPPLHNVKFTLWVSGRLRCMCLSACTVVVSLYKTLSYMLAIVGEVMRNLDILSPECRAHVHPSSFLRQLRARAWVPLNLVPFAKMRTGFFPLTRCSSFCCVWEACWLTVLTIGRNVDCRLLIRACHMRMLFHKFLWLSFTHNFSLQSLRKHKPIDNRLLGRDY